MILPHLHTDSVKELHTQAAQALAQVLALLPPIDQRKGVFSCLYLLMDGVGGPTDLLQLDECWIHGQTNVTERRRYSVFSNEKVFRFSEYFRVYRNIRSSYQAGRNRNNGHYAGAVLVRCTVSELGSAPVWLIFSISGLSEMEDEALAVCLAARMPWNANRDDIKSIVMASKNTLVPALLHTLVG